MNPISIEPGRVVLSRAGRDRGRALVVLSVEGEYATLADGRLRTVEKPKRKKMKHLSAKPVYISIIQEKLAKCIPLMNAEIRAELENVGYGQPDPPPEEG